MKTSEGRILQVVHFSGPKTHGRIGVAVDFRMLHYTVYMHVMNVLEICNLFGLGHCCGSIFGGFFNVAPSCRC